MEHWAVQVHHCPHPNIRMHLQKWCVLAEPFPSLRRIYTTNKSPGHANRCPMAVVWPTYYICTSLPVVKSCGSMNCINISRPHGPRSVSLSFVLSVFTTRPFLTSPTSMFHHPCKPNLENQGKWDTSRLKISAEIAWGRFDLSQWIITTTKYNSNTSTVSPITVPYLHPSESGHPSLEWTQPMQHSTELCWQLVVLPLCCHPGEASPVLLGDHWRTFHH